MSIERENRSAPSEQLKEPKEKKGGEQKIQPFQALEQQVIALCGRTFGCPVVSDTNVALPLLLEQFKDHLAKASSEEEKKEIRRLFLLLLERYPGSLILKEWAPELFGKEIQTFLEEKNMIVSTIPIAPIKQNRKKH